MIQFHLLIIYNVLEPTQYEYPQESPRNTQPLAPDYTIDYAALDYTQEERKIEDYDAFDYVNGDFGKVDQPSIDARPSKPSRPKQGKKVIIFILTIDLIVVC